jgi:hypothetical protein
VLSHIWPVTGLDGLPDVVWITSPPVNVCFAVHALALPKFSERLPEEVIVVPKRPVPAATEVTVPPEFASASAVQTTVPFEYIELTFCVPEQD